MRTRIYSFAQQCMHALLHLTYPPLCLHCAERLLSFSTQVFCHSCHELLQLINPSERCPYCFSSEYSQNRHICPKCALHSPICRRIAAAFDHAGPAATLVKKMKYGNRPFLAKGAAAFLAVQLAHLNWPIPDVIIPVPISFTRWVQRGYNQSFLLAKHFGKLIDRPVQRALRRVNGDYSQAGMRRHQRLRLSPRSFRLAKRQHLQDQSLLLIDDVMTTGSTLRCCAEILLEEYPKAIYGLTLCRAIQ